MNSIDDLHGVVVGLGSIGNRHMQILSSRVGRLTVVRRQQANAQFRPLDGVQVVHSVEQAIDARPDFTVICNPSHLHVCTAHTLVSAEIPCLIEKPLGSRLDRSVDQFVYTIAGSAAGKKSAMAYCMRYHGAYNTARRMIESGLIGRILYAKAWFEGFLPDWHPWEDYRTSYAARLDSGGGALRTLDHEIDYLNWTLGPATASSGMLSNSHAIEIEADDVAMVTSRHRQQVQSQITLSLCRKPPSRGFELVGEQGTIHFTMESGKLTTLGNDGKVNEVSEYSADDIDSMYIEMLDDFLRRVVGEATTGSLATIDDGLAALKVIDSVTTSMPPGSDTPK